ncbi:MAG: glycosyltransferase family protein [Burkholderiales bacterium]|nr:glycosyltransferase family protein [Burkholderiales bacterium]
MDSNTPSNPAHGLGISPAYLIRQGCSLLGANQYSEAQACFRQLLELEPDNADGHYWLGAMQEYVGQAAEAEPHLRRAIALNTRHADAHARLGLLLARRGEHEPAVQHYLAAVSIAPRHADAWCNLGLSLFALKRWDEAEQAYRGAIALQPTARVHSNLGNLLVDRQRVDEAEQHYQLATALEPSYAPAYDNLGVLRAEQGRRRDAEALFRQALALNADNAQAALNLAHLLLAEGRLEEGWRRYEARYSPRLPGVPIFVPKLPFPQWRGEPIVGKSLLVWLEQGLGDELQFCRYLPLLQQMGVGKLSFVCRPELFPLLRSLEGVDVLVPLGDEQADLSGHDYWSFTMSLPMCCGTTLENIPSQVPYLQAPTERVARWAPVLPQSGFKIGVAWRGNPIHHNDDDRSLPSLAVLAPLWTVPGTAFVSLQKGLGEDEAASPLAGQAIAAVGGQLADFGDTSAIVAQLDLVVCIDTSIAHLAGALGKPVWLLLPHHHPDWRWMLERADTPWYPTMRLWRQPARGDWASVIDAIRGELSLLVSGS